MSGLKIRRFTDSRLQEWEVLEHLGNPASPGYSGPSLVFVNSQVIRRVCDYPPDWYLLSDEALEALSWKV